MYARPRLIKVKNLARLLRLRAASMHLFAHVKIRDSGNDPQLNLII